MLMSGNIRAGVESPFAWLRLTAAVLIGTVGSAGMWAMPVVLPAVQADFAVTRADASLPYTLSMFGFAFGGVLMGRLADRFGVLVPVVCGAISFAIGFVGAGFAPGLMSFALAYVLIGFGASATFGPLMADMSQWFTRRRGIAVAIAASGNYIGGAFWPPVIQHFVASGGVRPAPIRIRLVCLLAILPPAPVVRARAPLAGSGSGGHDRGGRAPRPVAQRPAGGAVHRRSGLLRGDGDATGAHRRLLRRSRLWRRARRRDAGVDAGLRHCQPHWIGLRGRPHRRRGD